MTDIFSARTRRRRCAANAKWCIDILCVVEERQERDAEAGGADLWADAGPPARRCAAADVSGGLGHAYATLNKRDAPFWTVCGSRNDAQRTPRRARAGSHPRAGALFGRRGRGFHTALRQLWPLREIDAIRAKTTRICTEAEARKIIFEGRDSGGRYTWRPPSSTLR